MNESKSAADGGRTQEYGTLELPQRRGVRPSTTSGHPHVQLDQNAPTEMQEAVFEHGRLLPGVRAVRSGISLPNARAFVLGVSSAGGPREAFMLGREFAHLHGPADGSLHMTLPHGAAEEAIEKGWAERHQVAGRFGLPLDTVMVYGPRDRDELSTVTWLLQLSWNYAVGDRREGTRTSR